MNHDNSQSRETGMQRYQFSLKALVLAVLCFCVAGAMATWQRDAFSADQMKTPTWLFICLFGWNAAIVCQLAFSIWGRITLRQFATPASALVGQDSGCAEAISPTVLSSSGEGLGEVQDSPKHSETSKEHAGLRRAYIGGISWGVLSFFLWLSFAIIWLSEPSRAAEEEVAMAFCFTVWHLVPWTIVSYVRFVARSEWRKIGPLAAMRLAAVVGVAAPATGFAVYLMLQ